MGETGHSEKNRILLVEDDREICEMVDSYLQAESFAVDVFEEGRKAVEHFRRDGGYSLALVDLMLPDMSGMEVIREIRGISTVPIIIMTAKDSDTDKSLGLNLGADDYVVKPFSLIELTARIRANIRRASVYQPSGDRNIIRIRDLEIDPDRHEVKRGGTAVELTPTEFDILYLLAGHPGQAFSKERLYELVWKEPYFGNENVLNTHMNRLRQKLKSSTGDSSGDYIKTLWGIGYKMEER